jgi:hypothetical protein
MNSMRSYWKWLMASAGAGLLFTNCTIKSSTDGGSAGTGDGSCTVGTKHSGCTCPGNAIGSQTCLADGTFGSCECADSGSSGASSTSGGAAPTGGSTAVAGTGGTATTTAGAGGYSGGGGSAGVASAVGGAGAGGAAACDSGIDPTDCYSCLSTLCAPEWAACEAENETTVASGAPYCLSKGASADPGQIELVLDCVTNVRAMGTLAKRDAVRTCGSSVGATADPANFESWAPPQMTAATTSLMNCMADAPGTPSSMAGAWANDPTNFPESASPLPWDACTCAKIACTSAQ